MQKKKYVAAISDTDILIHLTRAGHLSLLNQLFEAVFGWVYWIASLVIPLK